jgi:hypothetical protein
VAQPQQLTAWGRQKSSQACPLLEGESAVEAQTELQTQVMLDPHLIVPPPLAYHCPARAKIHQSRAQISPQTVSWQVHRLYTKLQH